MRNMFEAETPIYLQLAAQISEGILRGDYPEGTPVPSTNELAAFYRINPATAGKAVNALVDDGLLRKVRGLGMYVTDGAKETLRKQRQQEFPTKFIRPLLDEAKRLGMTESEIFEHIKKEGKK